MALRTDVSSINIYGRATSGVKLMDLPNNDVLVSIALVSGERPERLDGELLEQDTIPPVDDDYDTGDLDAYDYDAEDEL